MSAPSSKRRTVKTHSRLVTRMGNSKPVPPEVYERMVANGLAEYRTYPNGKVRIVLTPAGRENLKRLESRERPTPQGRRFINSLGPFVR